MTGVPSDPVLQFIISQTTRDLINQGMRGAPYSRLSSSRMSRIGYRLIVLRCAQIGIDPPTRTEAEEWARS
jgi:hypothetical protein